jgi:hypothetical protein
MFPVSDRLSPKRMIRLKVGSGVGAGVGEGVALGAGVAVAVAVGVGVGVGCAEPDRGAPNISATAARRFVV